MIEQLHLLLSRMQATHLNILLLLGLALFGGTMGGRLFQKLRIPQVVGYIAIGIFIGESGLKLVTSEVVRSFEPFNYFALGLIGFMIGGELKKEVFTRYGKQFITILLSEGLTAFFVVTVSIGIVGTYLFNDWRFAWALGLLLGAIASATAPAATTEVLREYKTKGPLTRTVLGIVALDDALALLLFAIASSIAGSILGNAQGNVLLVFIHPLYEIFGSIAIGVTAGFILTLFLKKYPTEEKRLLAFSIGAILLTTGFSLAMNIDMLLAVMALGAFVINFTPQRSRDIFQILEGFTAPIFVLFFVLIGAKLNVSHMTKPVILIGCTYLIGRSAGKTFGANFGARISQAPKTVRKYLPFCLLSQAGVAIGLSILASHYFPGNIGSIIVVVITASTFILEIIGPAFVKFAVVKAGEEGLNINEEDLIAKTKAADIMDKNPPLIYKDMHLKEILEIFSESNNLYYPVVANDKKLLGIITVDNIKNIFIESGLNDLLLAVDVMEPATISLTPDSSLLAVKELFAKHNLEYLSITTQEKQIIGFIERRMLNRAISTKIMELQKQSDSLEEN